MTRRRRPPKRYRLSPVRHALSETPAECFIDGLSDDLFGRVFSYLTLQDKFRVELVSRRWNRIADEHVWPSTRRVDTGDVAGRGRMRGSQRIKLSQLFDRCSTSLTALDVNGERTTLFQLAPHLFEHRLQHLRHLRLYRVHLSEDDWPTLAEEFGPKLQTLMLEKCLFITTSATEDDVLPLEMGLFTRVERLLIEETYGQLQTGAEDVELKLVGASHPPNLEHYAIAYVENLWEWVRHAVADCPKLRSLRVNIEYAEAEDLDAAGQVLGQLDSGGLKELELVCYPPVSGLLYSLSRLSTLLPSLESLSLVNPRRTPAIRMQDLTDGGNASDRTVTQIVFPQLKSLRLRGMQTPSMQLISSVMHFPRLETLTLDEKAISLPDVTIFLVRTPTITTLASQLIPGEVRGVSKHLSLQLRAPDRMLDYYSLSPEVDEFGAESVNSWRELWKLKELTHVRVLNSLDGPTMERVRSRFG